MNFCFVINLWKTKHKGFTVKWNVEPPTGHLPWFSQADGVQVNAQDNFEDFKMECNHTTDSRWSHYTKWSTVQCSVECTMIICIAKLSINLEVKVSFVRKFVLFICLSVSRSVYLSCLTKDAHLLVWVKSINQAVIPSDYQSLSEWFHVSVSISQSLRQKTSLLVSLSFLLQSFRVSQSDNQTVCQSVSLSVSQ